MDIQQRNTVLRAKVAYPLRDYLTGLRARRRHYQADTRIQGLLHGKNGFPVELSACLVPIQ